MHQQGVEIKNRTDDSKNKNKNTVLPPNPNEVLEFTPRNDEEILRSTTYNFNLPVGKLINNSDDTRLARRNKKKGTKKIPRRQNAWIIYRRDKSVNPKFRGLRSAEISKEIGKMWNEEPREIKELFEVLEKMSDEIHEKKYKGYVYRPGPPKTKKKPKKIQKKNENTELLQNLNVFSAFENPQQQQQQQQQPHAMSSSSEFFPTPVMSSSEELSSLPSTPEESMTNFAFPFEESNTLPTPETSNLDSPTMMEFPASPTTTTTTIFPTPETSNLDSPILSSDQLTAEEFITPPISMTTNTHFFPDTTMIIPLSLGFEQNVLVDTRDNFFSAPAMTTLFFECEESNQIGPVCEFSQTNEYDDWVLYPTNNPREIDESQFSDYISY